MDPDYRLTVTSRYGDISNPILYFFSWAAIIVSYFIMVGYLMKRYSEWCERPPYAIYSSSSSPWVLVGFILTCFVVMMSANRMVIEGHCVDNDEDSDISRDWSDPTLPSKEVCNRLTSGTSAGTVSLVIYFVWLVINAIVVDEKYDGMLLIDVFLSGAMLFLWTFAAVWLTFDENESPAKDVCNLFFFTWASWVLSLIMAMNGFHYTVKLLTTSQKAPAIPAPERNFKRNEARLGDGHDVEGLTHSTLDDKPVEVDRSCS